MNQKQLLQEISAHSQLTQKDAKKFLDSFCGVVMKAIAEGQQLTLVGFGTFAPQKRKARTGRNPSTGENMEIPEKTVPVFKPSKVFKEAIAS